MSIASELPPPFNATPAPEPRSGLTLSLAFHAALALLIFLKTVVFPGQPIAYIPALRVDLVGLPEQLKNELKNPVPLPTAPPAANPPHSKEAEKPKPPEPQSKSAPKLEPDEIGLKKSQQRAEKAREKKMQSALDRIKALAALSGDSNTKAAAAPIAGNKISKGTSLSKDAQESDKANYVDTLQNALQQNWTLPMWLERQQLNAKVMIYIDANGRLIQYKFLQSSGSTQFDDAVKRTLMQSQPFPAPPAEIARSLAANGVLVGFPL
jgi:TonB family protein